MNIFSSWKIILVLGILVCAPVWADGDVAAGREKASTCAGCHGVNGEGFEQNPPIAGLDGQVLESGMQEYKTGVRTEAMMAMLMQALSDEDIADLAAYYASLAGVE